SAFEIDAADELFISGRELLLYEQFVALQNFSCVVHIRGLELNLVISELLATVAETDNPGRLRPRQFRTELHTCDHNIADRVGPPKQRDKAVPILPYSENENDSNEKQPPSDDPLSRSQKLEHSALPWLFLQRDLKIGFSIISQNRDGDGLTGPVTIDFRRQFDEGIHILAINSEDDVTARADKIVPDSNLSGRLANTCLRERAICRNPSNKQSMVGVELERISE